ncbi:hypothetical protein E2C01_031499 [Portunus trituberculatus]|uniref:Uncharacterized protein n=1 Tax=Portunus trituberculatus TaxID=210409 RepID=A0A5B7EUP9_PORTR|nr:hypothetical protein [Portunus trituberculatus]
MVMSTVHVMLRGGVLGDGRCGGGCGCADVEVTSRVQVSRGAGSPGHRANTRGGAAGRRRKAAIVFVFCLFLSHLLLFELKELGREGGSGDLDEEVALKEKKSGRG